MLRAKWLAVADIISVRPCFVSWVHGWRVIYHDNFLYSIMYMLINMMTHVIANWLSITSFTCDGCSLILVCDNWSSITSFTPLWCFLTCFHCSNQLWHGSITEIALHSSTLYSGKSKHLVHFIIGLPFVFCLSKAGCRLTVKLYFLLVRIHAECPCWPLHSSMLSSSLHHVWVCLPSGLSPGLEGKWWGTSQLASSLNLPSRSFSIISSIWPQRHSVALISRSFM